MGESARESRIIGRGAGVVGRRRRCGHGCCYFGFNCCTHFGADQVLERGIAVIPVARALEVAVWIRLHARINLREVYNNRCSK